MPTITLVSCLPVQGLPGTYQMKADIVMGQADTFTDIAHGAMWPASDAEPAKETVMAGSLTLTNPNNDTHFESPTFVAQGSAPYKYKVCCNAKQTYESSVGNAQ